MKSFCKLAILGIVLFSCLPAQSQLSATQRQSIILKRQVQRNHYSPRPINDSLSSSIFSSFIKALDEQQDIFTMDDYKTLSAYRYLLDNELNSDGGKFLDVATRLYRQQLRRADSLAKTILEKPLDFTLDDKITFSQEPAQFFAPDVKTLKNKWTRWFKYIMLNNAYSIASADSTRPALSAVLSKNEIAIREKMKKGQARLFESILDPSSFENEVKETYFNAIAESFDPHTNYFSPKEKENFQSGLSTEDLSFGFEIDEDKEGKIFISQLIPGGPAWKSGEIHKNDELLQLQWKGTPPVDVTTITAEEADELLQKANHDDLSIKIKKQNGTVRTISLRKEKIETEQDVVKGYLLDGEKKIGYIRLPDFYTTWENESGSGCANDMAKEIIKMKKENLDGLILDLRYNGGGSLNEALQMCGIFIDEGPLAATRKNDGKIVYLKDPNRGTIYDGPLIVMVNNQSASASEMVAAALQDYNRALIVGSPTYGKATMQEIFPMDSTVKTQANSPDGYVKITTGKLYRISGLTAQCNGVIPDILLPDAFDGLEFREKFKDNVLPADSIKKNNYYHPLPALPVASLAAASARRVSNDASFQKLVQGTQLRTRAMADKKVVVSLQPAAFEKWITEKESLLKAIDEKDESTHHLFTAGNYRIEKERLQNNIYAAELNAEALKSIQKDIYIRETFQVMTDLIRSQKTN
ncbi:MAG: carboxy terminal-processing peptidase [Bacteroidota bacterium]|nr:carboxy terminal-processing peptidase [Bacteroidota bacterium]